MQQTHEMKRSQPIVDKIIQLNYTEVPHKSLSIEFIFNFITYNRNMTILKALIKNIISFKGS